MKKVIDERLTIQIVDCDITKVPTADRLGVDAIIITINSTGPWPSNSMESTIDNHNGHYFARLREHVKENKLQEMDVFVSSGVRWLHRGEFNSVIFVVDEGEVSNEEAVYTGLKAAEKLDYCTKVAMPVFGMSFWRQSTDTERINRIAENTVKGIKRYLDDYPEPGMRKLREIYFVISRHPAMTDALRKAKEGLTPKKEVKKSSNDFFSELFEAFSSKKR